MIRLGRFKVTKEFLDCLETEEKRQFYQNMQVTDKRENSKGVIEHIAIHSSFRWIDEGEFIPEYEPKFTNGSKCPYWVEVN